MSSTKQGPFDMAYHHIDAPTMQDDEYWKQFKKRKLIVPSKGDSEPYRSPLLAYLAELPWKYSRKLNGENIRIQWDGEQALWNGKSNAFQCSAEFTEYMNNTFLEEIFEEKFGRDRVVTLFGEKMGPKTQGNELGLEKDEVVLYDVNVDGTWLNPVDVFSIAEYFSVQSVWRDRDYCSTLRHLISRCADGEFKEWEGIVTTPLMEMRDQNNKRIIVKIKNKDYLR